MFEKEGVEDPIDSLLENANGMAQGRLMGKYIGQLPLIAAYHYLQDEVAKNPGIASDGRIKDKLEWLHGTGQVQEYLNNPSKGNE